MAGSGEQTVLGGLKTKNIDVVVTKSRVGPVIAVSMKGTLGAFRNLTNRMEEAVGDCTNIHIAYPALVYGFLHVLRAVRESPDVPATDWGLAESGEAVGSIRRYHDIVARLSDRLDLRDDPTKYEAVSLILAGTDSGQEGWPHPSYPDETSRLAFATFFERLYQAYDLRFVYAAPNLRGTRRTVWDANSPAFQEKVNLDYQPRQGEPVTEEDPEE